MESESEMVAARTGTASGGNDRSVPSPEEVAREFLRQSGGLQPPDDPPSRRHETLRAWAPPIAGVVVVVAVLAGIAALVLLPTRHNPGPTPAQTISHQHHATPPRHVGSTSTTAASTTTTTTTTTAPQSVSRFSSVTVDVLDASGSGHLATSTASALRALGFHVGAAVAAPGPIPAGQPSQVLYGLDGLAAAEDLSSVLGGPLKAVRTPNLTGSHLQLWVANPQLTVKGQRSP